MRNSLRSLFLLSISFLRLIHLDIHGEHFFFTRTVFIEAWGTKERIENKDFVMNVIKQVFQRPWYSDEILIESIMIELLERAFGDGFERRLRYGPVN